MRDIRNDLRERLTEVESERRHLKEQLAVIDQEEHVVRRMLAHEDARWSGRQHSLFAPPVIEPPMSPIRAFLLEAMSDGQSWSLERLKERAKEKELELKTDRPGQALHAALVAMKRSGLAEIVETGVWRRTNVDAPPAETDGASG